MRRSFQTVFLLAFCLSIVGCSKASLVPARISGKISYKGAPVKGGAMRFYTPEGTGYDAVISPDGTYSANDLPVGEMVITVDTEGLQPTASKGKDSDRRASMPMQKAPAGVVVDPPKPADYYVKIPAKYRNPKTSPLTQVLAAGRQVKDFDLTD